MMPSTLSSIAPSPAAASANPQNRSYLDLSLSYLSFLPAGGGIIGVARIDGWKEGESEIRHAQKVDTEGPRIEGEEVEQFISAALLSRRRDLGRAELKPQSFLCSDHPSRVLSLFDRETFATHLRGLGEEGVNRRGERVWRFPASLLLRVYAPWTALTLKGVEIPLLLNTSCCELRKRKAGEPHDKAAAQ